MTSVMAHFHQKPETLSLTASGGRDWDKDCQVLTIEGEGNSLDLFFYGDAVDRLVEAVENFARVRRGES